MSSVIHTNMTAIRTGNIYNKNTNAMADAMNRVSTGMKVNSAKDNASTWAITEKMRERIRANDQANQNIQNDSALLRTAQDGFGNTLDILKTLKERAINSANDSNVNSDRTKIVEEVKQLVAQIDDNAAKVKFNGRQLLNGGVESPSAASSVNSDDPEVVAAAGPYAKDAVFGITDLAVKSGGSTLSASSKLTELVDGDGNTLFQAGDVITLKYTLDGEEKETSITVDSSTTIEGIGVSGELTAKYYGASTNINDTTSTPLKDVDGKNIQSTSAGVYFVGADNKVITDLSISVKNAEGVTKTDAQKELTPTAVAQSYGDGTKGSNEVWKSGLNFSSGTHKGDASTLKEMGASGDVKIEINGTELTFAKETTLENVTKEFQQHGINVEFHDLTNATDALTYDGKTVTMGSYGVNFNGGQEGLNVVGAEGYDITSLSITNGTTALTTEEVLKLDDGDSTATASTSTTSSDTLLPQGEALQFFVGGEQNFGVNFTLGKATNETLFGMSGDDFAAKFATKEGAEEAIGMIDDAISKVLVEQTRLGAMEARLGYTSDNITTMNENLEAGFSAYRDADIAKEMTEYMKQAVLSQAAQYMLSQSNQNAFQVLNFLQQ